MLEQTSLLPDSQCHWQEGGEARERRERQGGRCGGGGERRTEGVVHKLEMIFHFPLQNAIPDSYHSKDVWSQPVTAVQFAVTNSD